MRVSEAIHTVLNEPSDRPLPGNLEFAVESDIPLAIAKSARAICEHLARIETTLRFVCDEIEKARRGFKS